MPTKTAGLFKTQVTRIMIVDDHPIVRDGLSMLLSGYPSFQVIAQAEDIADAMRKLSDANVDVAVVDISLKAVNGLDLIRRMLTVKPTLRILVVSMFDENLYGERTIAAGAMGYLNKQAASRQIVEAICQILDGKLFLSNDLSQRLITRRIQTPRALTPSGIDSLTNRELDVFRLIGAGHTTNEVAKNLHLSVKTIETHRQNIKLKLNLSNAAELSREAAHWFLQNG